ncbi:Piso0_003714 [Millerozyma farinosa CBS 7064]|uniref:Piso0_003714 protein n=1 Tax=Pichia sorbitophila (strain ATCC MYA-4447 / BCRC 22081 / CBS 7064 / NBRC 10061 / NRRL Y-12695) TaxID=559304 RepID=G8YAT8_PICSO|nr:Piso0_003714 [Millerozyma farinosa CBS 7064]CCE84173.1 Piso0_003714 [Millerozyma farinosa CBS 7064]
MRVSLHFLSLTCFIACVLGNTETHLLRVPKYFSINPHPAHLDENSIDIISVNSTHQLLLDYPIDTAQNQHHGKHQVALYQHGDSVTEKKLYVKVNNYGDEVFQAKDLLYVKLCWPATLPYEFTISHEFQKLSEIYNQQKQDSFDLYFVISYKPNFVTYDDKFRSEVKDLKFHLYISKLPSSWLPIPIELYDYVTYLAALLTISYKHILPYIYEALFGGF